MLEKWFERADEARGAYPDLEVWTEAITKAKPIPEDNQELKKKMFVDEYKEQSVESDEEQQFFEDG